MTTRTARWLAWALWGLFWLIMGCTFVLGLGSGVGTSPGEYVQLLSFATFATVGALVASRHPSNAIGWIFCALGLGLALVGFADTYSAIALVTRSRSLPAGVYVAWFYDWSWLPLFLASVTLPLLLFPDGKLPSRRWRPVGWIVWGVIALGWIPLALLPGRFQERPATNPFGVESELVTLGSQAVFLLFPVLLIASMAALVFRFRRSRGEERQQLKWFTYAAALLTLTGVASIALDSFAGILVPESVFAILVAFLAVAVGIAMFKYRLYDIDIVISKTVVYGLLAAFITAVYVAIVVGVGRLLGSGGEPDLGLSIAATAIVALAFQPVRARVQHLANRLVYGKRATPYEVLVAFGERMAATPATEDVLPRLARALAEGTGAFRAVAWLRVEDELRPASWWPPDREPDHDPVPLSGSGLPLLPDVSLALPVVHRGDVLGALSLTKSPGERLTPTEERLAADLASQAGLVLRNVRLTEELLLRLDELRDSRKRLVGAQDEERRRLERDIHDGAQQQLVALALKLRLARSRALREPQRADDLLVQLQAEVQQALQDLRDLARGIYPPLLADQGLGAALRAHVRKAGLPVEVELDGVGRYPPEAEAAVYFCALEALQNAAKYSGASTISMRLSGENGHLTFTVEDAGRGFVPESTPRGAGMTNMSDRLEALGRVAHVTTGHFAG
ncbi:MAG: hypothetical protein H0W27_03070 [Actinobacteria bacterium]|nr:hypothetical protein [Actinomycetota bacterium]